MTTPINPLPTPPALADSPVDFNTKAFALLGALPAFVTEANAQASGVDAAVLAAETEADAAALKAGEALTSANNAALSKTGADSARDASVAAKNAAEAALDSFDDRYLGAKAVAPATDNDGGALLTGALYWDTSLPGMRSWNGGAWVTLPAATAAAISNTPSGTISATTVQGAINELAEIKVDLAAATGASLVGFQQEGTGAVSTTVQAKLRESVSVKDFGAVVDGVADDTTAIQSARAVASVNGGTVVYNGKTHAAGFWENLVPLAQEWIKGSPTAYATDIVASKPLISAKLFNGTPLAGSGAGFAGYGQRTDCYTKAGVDVASSVAGLFSMQSYSTNSTGANFNDTYQVALVANSSAMDAASSASVEAFNAIAFSGYTGALAQQMVGTEVDIGANRAPGWFGEANKTYGVAYSANVAAGNSDVTAAFTCNTTNATQAFLHGAVLAGVRYTGLTIARNGTTRPETGVWISAAQTYGMYIGAKNKWSLNSGSTADYAYKPVIGLALGQEGPTSAKSHTLRLTSASPASVEQHADVFIDAAGNLQVQFNGANVFTLEAAGTLLINGTQVLAGRRTGYVAMSGASNSWSALDTATVTLVQLAQRVASLQASLTQMGILGT